jgi:hypothetical protein
MAGVTIARLKMNPDLDPALIDDLLDQGIGVVDYATGASLNHTLAPEESQKAAKRSFDTYRRLVQQGGYVVMTDDGHERILVGHVSAPAGFFPTFRATDAQADPRPFKAFQFDRIGEVDAGSAANREALKTLVDNHGQLATFVELGSENAADGPEIGRETVLEAFHDLEAAGELDRP